MWRHRLRAPLDDVPDIGDEFLELRIAEQIDQRMVASRRNPLPEHDLYPAGLREQFLGLPGRSGRCGGTDPSSRCSAAGTFIVRQSIPEAVAALGRMVMQDQEVADAFASRMPTAR